MSELADREFTEALVSKLKELTKTISKELKDCIMTMSHQLESINEETEKLYISISISISLYTSISMYM